MGGVIYIGGRLKKVVGIAKKAVGQGRPREVDSLICLFCVCGGRLFACRTLIKTSVPATAPLALGWVSSWKEDEEGYNGHFLFEGSFHDASFCCAGC